MRNSVLALFLIILHSAAAVGATRDGVSQIEFNCDYLAGTWVGEFDEGQDRYSWKVELKTVAKEGGVTRFEFMGEFFDHNDVSSSKQYGYDHCDGRTIVSVVRVEGGDLDGMEVQWTYKIINLNRTDYVYQYMDGSGNGPVFRSKRSE